MLLSKIEVAYEKHDVARICQGDILRDFSIVDSVIQLPGHPIETFEESKRDHPYLVVLTQDCDLEQDQNNRADATSKNQDKYLHTVLLCPAYPAELVRLGKHLESIGLRMSEFQPWRWDQLKKNNIYRYHYLLPYAVHQVPELVMDFKHYITVPRDVLYKTDVEGHYLATINELFREALSTRFAYYLSRVALPI